MAVVRKKGVSSHDKRRQLPIKPLSVDIPQGDPIDLSYPEALKYLRGEALVLPPDSPRGIVTVTYKGFALGPAKNIGNRANNLYPKPWRIKTTHLPDEAQKVLLNDE